LPTDSVTGKRWILDLRGIRRRPPISPGPRAAPQHGFDVVVETIRAERVLPLGVAADGRELVLADPD